MACRATTPAPASARRRTLRWVTATACVVLTGCAAPCAGWAPLPAAMPTRAPVATGRRAVVRSGERLGTQLERFDPSSIRCPFFRRRAADALEAAVLVGRWLKSRHKSLDLSFGLFPAFTHAVDRPDAAFKAVGCSHDELLARLHGDFAERQSQVTGRLSQEYFADGCVFDGPDPDMPVRGLRKYLAATQQLFTHRTSRCDLLAIASVPACEVAGAAPASSSASPNGLMVPVVLWRIEGVINLPWHPRIKPYVGATVFWPGEHDGLVSRATEFWSIPAADAFISTVLPALGCAPAPPAAELRAQLAHDPAGWASLVRDFPALSEEAVVYPTGDLDGWPDAGWFAAHRAGR